MKYKQHFIDKQNREGRDGEIHTYRSIRYRSTDATLLIQIDRNRDRLTDRQTNIQRSIGR